MSLTTENMMTQMTNEKCAQFMTSVFWRRINLWRVLFYQYMYNWIIKFTRKNTQDAFLVTCLLIPEVICTHEKHLGICLYLVCSIFFFNSKHTEVDYSFFAATARHCVNKSKMWNISFRIPLFSRKLLKAFYLGIY